jgi:PadR family transcriptional regulator PadR
MLTEKDSYGYEIIKSILLKSNKKYELKEPSLYTSLKRLEKGNFINSYWGDESLGGRRKYYKITDSGREKLEKSFNDWLIAKEIIDLLLN